MSIFMSKNYGFRAWYYFRNGWSLYFAFIFAAINTLTVTYYLAIENIPELKIIFPSFGIYIMFTVFIGIPLLVLLGYMHFKRSMAYRSETEVVFESNPYVRRALVNSELSIKLNLQLIKLLTKLSQNQSIPKEEIDEIISIQNDLNKFISDRKFLNNKDLDFIKKMKES